METYITDNKLEEQQNSKKLKCERLTVNEYSNNQRIDNFLIKVLKGVPKSKIYNIIRTGEVRINGKRAKASQKVLMNDIVRIPPLKRPEVIANNYISQLNLDANIIYENENILVLNKPQGIPVHSGAGYEEGIIEVLRKKDYPFIELMHRIDKDTSGILMVAKNRKSLVSAHEKWKNYEVKKRYLLLAHGAVKEKSFIVNQPLMSCLTEGKRVMKIHPEGKSSITKFKLLRQYGNYSLLFAWPVTGRTHQIRAHAQYAGLPLVGDVKYGNATTKSNEEETFKYLPKLFLHSSSIRIKNFDSVTNLDEIICPMTQQQLKILKSLNVLYSTGMAP